MANENDMPQWRYTDFKQAFGLQSMSYDDMKELGQEMVYNKSYLDTYFRYD